MKLTEFISNYDYEGSVVLMEGKRKVNVDDESKLIALGSLLAAHTKHMLFRSGNAEGSDLFFSKGVAAINPQRLQVITPYKGHRVRHNLAGHIVNLDDISLKHDDELVLASRDKADMKRLVDRYVAGERGSLVMKAAYILRDSMKVLGGPAVPKASFAVFYDDLKKPMQGGTGHTIKKCKEQNIPHINQRIWFSWLTEKL